MRIIVCDVPYQNQSYDLSKMLKKWPTKFKFSWQIVKIVQTKLFFYMRN